MDSDQITTVAAAVIEAIEFDAGLDPHAGGSDAWTDAPVRDSGTTETTAWYVLEARDGSRWRVTVEAEK